MGTRLPVVSGREAARAFEKLGWILLRFVTEPWAGAGDAARIAEARVALPRGRTMLLGVVGLAVSLGSIVSRIRFQFDPGVESDVLVIGAVLTLVRLCVIALAVTYVIVHVVDRALSRHADACRRSIVCALYKVQHAAEAWFAAHGKEGKLA